MIKRLIPFESERISAIPIIPMLPANEVSIVLPFFVRRFLKESEIAVPNDMDFFLLLAFSSFLFFFASISAASSLAKRAAYSSSVIGLVSPTTLPSERRTILVEYSSASSGL